MTVLRYAIAGFLLLVFYIPRYAKGMLMIKPEDREVMVGHSTYFNCSTSIQDKNLDWYFYAVGAAALGRKYVYAFGKLYSPFDSKIRIDDSSVGVRNLIILSATLEDAGRYVCHDDGGLGEHKEAQLNVATYPACDANTTTHLVVGPNSCGVEPDELTLSCSVSYNGSAPPILQWKSSRNNESLDQFVAVGKTSNIVTYNFTKKVDLEMNGSFFFCETTRFTSSQYNCTSAVIDVIYMFTVNSTVNRNVYIGDEIDCSVNKSKDLMCEYKWKWFEGDDSITKSVISTLKPTELGWYRCDVSCNITKGPCNILVMRANVSRRDKKENMTTVPTNQVNTDSNSSSPATIAVSIVVVVLLLIIVVLAVLCAIYVRSRKKKNPRSTVFQILCPKWAKQPPPIVEIELNHTNEDDLNRENEGEPNPANPDEATPFLEAPNVDGDQTIVRMDDLDTRNVHEAIPAIPAEVAPFIAKSNVTEAHPSEKIVVHSLDTRNEDGVDGRQPEEPSKGKQKSTLEVNRKVLVYLINPSENLLRRLRSKEVITENQKRELASIPTEFDKVHVLLEILLEILNQGKLKDYQKAIRCLRETEHGNVADVLEEGEVVVRVHSQMCDYESSDKTSQIEDNMVTSLTRYTQLEMSELESAEIDSILEATKAKIIAAKRGGSVVLYVSLAMMEHLRNLEAGLESGKLKNAIQRIYENVIKLLIGKLNPSPVEITTELHEGDLDNAKGFLQRESNFVTDSDLPNAEPQLVKATEDNWVEVIRTNFNDLVQKIDTENDFYGALKRENIFTNIQLKRFWNHKISSKRITLILQCLQRKDFFSFKKFCAALYRSEQSSVVREHLFVVKEPSTKPDGAIDDANAFRPISSGKAKCLIENYTELIVKINFDNELLKHLGTCNTFTPVTFADLEETTDTIRRGHKILDNLANGSEKQYNEFCEALKATKQSHIVLELLTPPADHTISPSQPSGEQNRSQQPSREQSRIQQPSGEQSRIQQASGEQSRIQQASGEQNRSQQPSREQSRIQQPSGEQSRIQQPSGEQSLSHPSGGQNRSQQPSGEQTLTAPNIVSKVPEPDPRKERDVDKSAENNCPTPQLEMATKDQWEQVIRTNFNYLIEKIDTGEDFYGALMDEKIFTNIQLKKFWCAEISSKRITLILQCLERKDYNSFKKFCSALEKSDQDYIVRDYLSVVKEPSAKPDCATEHPDAYRPVSFAKAQCLKQNHTILIDKIDFGGQLLSQLGARNTFTTITLKELEETKDKTRRGHVILEKLANGSEKQYNDFCDALIVTKQQAVIELLTPTVVNVKNRSQLPGEVTLPTQSSSESSGFSQCSDEFRKRLTEEVTQEKAYKCDSTPLGRAVIINNQRFTQQSLDRDGAHKDSENLKFLFEKLGFRTIIHADRTAKEITEILTQESKEECHIGYDMFVLFLLSHGIQGKIYGVDNQTVETAQIISLFDGNNCPNLVRKPKIIFIQACQGNLMTTGATASYVSDEPQDASAPLRSLPKEMIEKLLEKEDINISIPLQPLSNVQCDAKPEHGKVHEKADMAIFYATVEGYVAWRRRDTGSVFVECLTNVLTKNAHESDLMSMATEVLNALHNYEVLLDGEAPQRQIGEKRDTLRKKVYLLPRRQTVS